MTCPFFTGSYHFLRRFLLKVRKFQNFSRNSHFSRFFPGQSGNPAHDWWEKTDHNQVGYNSPTDDTLTDIYLNDDWNVYHVSWACNESQGTRTHARIHTHTHPPTCNTKTLKRVKIQRGNQTRHLYGVWRLWFLSASVLCYGLTLWEIIFSILSFDPNRNHPEQPVKIPGCTNNTKQTPVSIATR